MMLTDRACEEGAGSELPAEIPGVPTFALKRPRFLSLPLVAAMVAAPVGMLIPWLDDALSGSGPPIWRGLTFILVVSAAVAGLACVMRALTRPKRSRVLELHENFASLPVTSTSRRSRQVSYEEITSMNVFGKGRWARMLLATRRRNFVYPLAHFEGGADASSAFRRALRERIAAGPGGAEQLLRIDALDARGSEIVRKPYPATVALLLLSAAAYVWTWGAGALDDPFGLVGYGGNAPALVAQGEWYRLLAANFLHLNWLHLYLNALGVYVLGMLLERLVGSWRFVCIYLISAAAGAGASALVSDAALSVGASTAVFGLLGAHAFLNWRCRGSLPGGFAQPLRSWLIVVALNVALPFLVPLIDWAAHVGGFMAGVLVAALSSPGSDADRLGRTPLLPFKVATAALCTIYCAALGQAFLGALRDDGSAGFEIAAAFMEQESIPPSTLNGIAWQYAIKPNSPKRSLRSQNAPRRVRSSSSRRKPRC